MVKVLLVDDEVAFTTNVSKLLAKRGCEVAVANNGQSALQTIEKNDFEVVVLDMRMPGMNGLETMKAMRAMKPSLQVIILTGHASIDTAIEGVRLGACDFVTKPIAIDELVEKIQGAYRRAMLREEFGKSNK